jgi:hypothetical protein
MFSPMPAPAATASHCCQEVNLVVVQMRDAQAVHSSAAFKPDISAALVKGEWWSRHCGAYMNMQHQPNCLTVLGHGSFSGECC